MFLTGAMTPGGGRAVQDPQVLAVSVCKLVNKVTAIGASRQALKISGRTIRQINKIK